MIGALDMLLSSVKAENGVNESVDLLRRVRSIRGSQPTKHVLTSTTCGTITTDNINSIDARVEAFQLSLRSIHEEAARRTARLHKQRNELCARPKLPIELLISILHMSIHEETYKLNRLAHLSTISTLWWHVIKEGAPLWTSIRSEEAGLEVALQRSKGLHLMIRVDQGLEPSIFSPPSKAFEARAEVLIREKRRWRTALVRSGGDLAFSAFGEPLPMLESAKLHGGGLQTYDFRGGPKLNHLHVSGISIIWTRGISLASLVTLHLESQMESSQMILPPLKTLSSRPRLRSLHLEHIETAHLGGEEDVTPPSLVGPRFSLNTLHTLRLNYVYGPMLAIFLRSLHAPNLAAFQFRDEQSLHHELPVLESFRRPDDTLSLLGRVIQNSSPSDTSTYPPPGLPAVITPEIPTGPMVRWT